MSRAARPAAAGVAVEVPSLRVLTKLGRAELTKVAPITASPMALNFSIRLAGGLKLLRVPVASAAPMQKTMGYPIFAGSVMGLFESSLEADARMMTLFWRALMIASRIGLDSSLLPHDSVV